MTGWQGKALQVLRAFLMSGKTILVHWWLTGEVTLWVLRAFWRRARNARASARLVDCPLGPKKGDRGVQETNSSPKDAKRVPL